MTDVTSQMDQYDLAGACATVREFLDALTNWYVRRSRDRFWAGRPGRDRHVAHGARGDVPRRRAALPLTAEAIWRGLTGGRSVHLTDWPLVDSTA